MRCRHRLLLLRCRRLDATPAAAAHSAAAAEAAIACTTAATAATATATATRAQTVRLASVFFENLVAGLDLAASLDGLVALPHPQLCHRLAMHREVQTGGWRQLAEAILAQLLPPPPPALPTAPETALPTAPETALLTAPGGAPALAMPAAASSASPLLTAIGNPKRSAALEVHVALLLLLGLLLARPGSSAAADGGLPHTTPPVAADDVEPDSLHAPMHREQLRSLQRDLATCMCARGLPQALYACAQRLYDAFKALAPVEGGDGIGPGGAGGGSGNGLLTVKELAPELRTLVPFFTDEYAKVHVDPFVDALDHGAECRHPDARPHDCARAARFRVHRCQDVQVTTRGAEADQVTTWARQRTRARPRRRASPSLRPSPR